jgi:hypothetical protein
VRAWGFRVRAHPNPDPNYSARLGEVETSPFGDLGDDCGILGDLGETSPRELGELGVEETLER